MALAAWNPSTLKLYSSANGLICSSCCSTTPTTCPATYTVSFSGLTSCPAPSMPIFITGKTYRYPTQTNYADSFVIYNGRPYVCISSHFADQWYSWAWIELNFAVNAERFNRNYVLTGGGPNPCSYEYHEVATDPWGFEYYTFIINLQTDVAGNMAYLRLRAAHAFNANQNDLALRWIFAALDNPSPADPCVTLTNDYDSGDCFALPLSFANPEAVVIGHSGTAKIVPGSFDSWSVNHGYAVGNIVVHRSEKYECVTGHYSTVANEPGVGDVWNTYWSVNTDC